MLRSTHPGSKRRRQNQQSGRRGRNPSVEFNAVSKSQLEMDSMRAEERKIFTTATADLEQGIPSVQKALTTP